MPENRTKTDGYMLRLPDGMRDELKAAAAANERSLNAEIVARLSGQQRTLRDEFAMAALTGLLAGDGGLERPVHDATGWAFHYADCMLESREAQP